MAASPSLMRVLPMLARSLPSCDCSSSWCSTMVGPRCTPPTARSRRTSCSPRTAGCWKADFHKQDFIVIHHSKRHYVGYQRRQPVARECPPAKRQRRAPTGYFYPLKQLHAGHVGFDGTWDAEAERKASHAAMVKKLSDGRLCGPLTGSPVTVGTTHPGCD